MERWSSRADRPGYQDGGRNVGGRERGGTQHRRFKPAVAVSEIDRRRRHDRHAKIARLGVTMVAVIPARDIGPLDAAVEKQSIGKLRTTAAHDKEREREQGANAV